VLPAQRFSATLYRPASRTDGPAAPGWAGLPQSYVYASLIHGQLPLVRYSTLGLSVFCNLSLAKYPPFGSSITILRSLLLHKKSLFSLIWGGYYTDIYPVATPLIRTHPAGRSGFSCRSIGFPPSKGVPH